MLTFQSHYSVTGMLTNSVGFFFFFHERKSKFPFLSKQHLIKDVFQEILGFLIEKLKSTVYFYQMTIS